MIPKAGEFMEDMFPDEAGRTGESNDRVTHGPVSTVLGRRLSGSAPAIRVRSTSISGARAIISSPFVIGRALG